MTICVLQIGTPISHYSRTMETLLWTPKFREQSTTNDLQNSKFYRKYPKFPEIGRIDGLNLRIGDSIGSNNPGSIGNLFSSLLSSLPITELKYFVSCSGQFSFALSSAGLIRYRLAGQFFLGASYFELFSNLAKKFLFQCLLIVEIRSVMLIPYLRRFGILGYRVEFRQVIAIFEQKKI